MHHAAIVSECERLPDIANGHVVLSGTSVGSTATYSCATGFELVGKSVRRCRNDGSWSLEEPFCKGLHDLLIYLFIH